MLSNFINLILTSFWDIVFKIVSSLTVVQAAYSDAAEPWQCDFQEPASPIQEGIINLHDDVMFYLCFISGFVFTFFFFILYFFNDNKATAKIFYPMPLHHTFLEFVWTLLPSLLLVTLVVPTFALIYSMDDIVDAQITLKVIGHQWYWSYEYGDLTENIDQNFTLENLSYTFDSYMVAEDDLVSGTLRLLEVDHRLILPTDVHIRVMITSADVLHSWAVPSLGVKLDACPGRLSQVGLYISRPGVFYGQCSEICGVNHAFMPICVETV